MFAVALVISAGVIVWMTSSTGLTTCCFNLRPVVALQLNGTTAAGANILVAGIEPTANPSNFKVNIENVSSGTFGGASAMPTTSGGSVSVTVGTGLAETVFSITWQNPRGSGTVSQGDHFAVSKTSGAYETGTSFSFLLIWNDGSTDASQGWVV